MRLIDADKLTETINKALETPCYNAYQDGYDAALNTLLDYIADMPTIPAAQWIRVEERLPGWSGDYICVSRDKNGREWVIPAEWSREMKTWFGRFGEIRNKVTHWMPLPEPPEEVRDDGKSKLD